MNSPFPQVLTMSAQNLDAWSHFESSAIVSAASETVFALLDDPERLSSHMNRSSWQMGGGRMRTILDAGRGQRVGSHIQMRGRMLGIELSLDEVVTEREPPNTKIWETVGSPKLLVIGAYRMGFHIVPRQGGSSLTVFIDYSLPSPGWQRWLGLLAGRYYARWCTQTMVNDAVRRLSNQKTQGG